MRILLTILLGISALFIAGCSAYFSVRGLGNLFIGAATGVMVMAASLELGKLVAASFLYQYWSRITIAVRLYLLVAVGVLIGITSLGIYGYLARAYERTNADIALMEKQIESLNSEMKAVQAQIDGSQVQIGKLSEAEQAQVAKLRQQISEAGKSQDASLARLEDRRKAARDKRDKAVDKLHLQTEQAGKSLDQSLARLEDRRKAARDKRDAEILALNAKTTESAKLMESALASEDVAITALNERVAVLDRAVDAYTREGGSGFLKEDSIKKGQMLRQEQQAQRDAISAEIAQRQEAKEQHRKKHAGVGADIDQRIAEARGQATKDEASIDEEEKSLRKASADAAAAIEVKIAAAGEQLTRDSAALDEDERSLRKAHADAVSGDERQLASLQTKNDAVLSDGGNQIEALRQRLRTGNEEKARYEAQIANTDVGSYRFVARAFNTSVDDVVKWLIIVIVLVFDPLAVALTIGFNVAVNSHRRQGAQGSASSTLGMRTAGGDAGAGEASAGVPSESSSLSSRGRAVIATGAVVLVIALLGGGAYLLRGAMEVSARSAHGDRVPADSFAVAAISPSVLRQPVAGKGDGGSAPTGVLSQSFVGGLTELLRHGFDPQADVYAFVKYPTERPDKPGERPVILCGLVAKVSDPAAAEAALSQWAENMERAFRPASASRAPLSRNRVMVQYGRGRYLDPERGFFTYGLTDNEAIVVLEIEGDPNRPRVEQEIRLCLATQDSTPGATKMPTGAARTQPLPVAADGAVAIWFDGARCFADMPKSAAAQARYQQLQRHLDFQLMLSMTPTAAGELRVTGQYNYASERFRDGASPSVMELLAKLGPPGAAGVPGQLMDRCADTLDFDSLVERLRVTLSGAPSGQSGAKVVAEKSTDSTRQAHFALVARYDPQAGPPMAAAFRSLSPF